MVLFVCFQKDTNHYLVHMLQKELEEAGSSNAVFYSYLCSVPRGAGSAASLRPDERPQLQSPSPAAILTDGLGIKRLRVLNAHCCQSHLSQAPI